MSLNIAQRVSVSRRVAFAHDMMANRKMLAFFAAAVLLVLDSCAAAKTVGERSASASGSGEAIHLTPRLTEKPIRLPFKDDETGAAPPTPFEHSSGYDAHFVYSAGAA